ncbi:hypothetical protein BKA82DRAFT_141033 [Pisolithus tinctorius]|uniref:Uncharacterized protein n=1 Tax=Pisolithus tinctorius Marx 270 TaxID=870435 RepID=A0A0C3PCK7_PISTI|nr:hypothetical protein BKA82DRAFT_141033 [Pisolithus tinctorius]KIO05459.1 hypothetical protein M404DRAFT_141033 [Pisolithus tinctorius Marx 270]
MSNALIAARSRLFRTGLYLADEKLCEKVHWVPHGHGHTLALLPQYVPGDVSADDTAAAPHVLACLAAIVCVDSKDFWLLADGGYQGPNHISKEIVEVKPSCAICTPYPAGMLNNDFTSVVSNLRLLQDRCVTSGYSPGKSFFSTDGLGNPCFKVRHTFLEVRTRLMYSEADDLFSFENWPLTKEKNCAELLTLKSTHCLVPLAAMDVSGHRVSPFAYRRCLQDAIVELHFTFSHWGIARSKQDVYAANIVFMRVLVPPRAFSMPANKRMAPTPAMASDSTAKKSRVD